MNDKDEKKIDRREFMKSGATGAIVGLSVLKLGLKEARAQAKQTGRPLLTDRAVNSLFLRSGAKSAELAAEARRDVKGFVKRNFTLNSAQEQQLESLSAEEIEAINANLALVEKRGSSLTVRFGPQIKGAEPPAGNQLLPPMFKCKITITIEF
ncbi:MAG: hypothetical protein AABO41_27655 [Acidobacteriota bacterium]